MKLQHNRPEDRSRSGSDRPVWADTLPSCFRSEGFAEDLHEAQATPSAAVADDKPKWLRDAAFPLLGVALAGVMGVFAR